MKIVALFDVLQSASNSKPITSIWMLLLFKTSNALTGILHQQNSM